MKRREFLKGSATVTAAGVGLATLGLSQAEAAAGGKREYYELRVYRLKDGSSSPLLEKYLQTAAIPAWNRLGLKNVGVFKEKEPKQPAVFVLLTYPNLDAMAKVATKLNSDKKYLADGAEYLGTTKASPGFERIDSWFLLAFAGMPKLELAEHSRQKNPDRIFELRTYESYSEQKAAKKVAMFDDGEIDIMREVGLAPVFYGEGIFGSNLPHLTYMTSGENEAAHKKHWDAFRVHPKWEEMKNDPQYADTVSKSTIWMLKPTSYSQI